MSNDEFKIHAYAAKHKSEQVIEVSSSGGAFTAFSDWILEQGGIIIGAIFDNSTQMVHHVIAQTSEERDLMRGSKYIWSDLNNVFNQSVPYIQDKIWTLFVGTPCQVAGYKAFLRNKNLPNDRVILCDIVCHGTPDPKIWKDYVSIINKKYGNIDKLNFRDKRNGWSHPTTYAYCGNKEISIADYTDIFYSQCALQNKCYSCKYASLVRPGDITIGDCWGIDKISPDFSDDQGVSLIIVHSHMGNVFLDRVKSSLMIREIPINDCLQPNLKEPTSASPEREKFLKEYKKYGIRYILAKYSKHHFYGRIRHKIKYILSR